MKMDGTKRNRSSRQYKIIFLETIAMHKKLPGYIILLQLILIGLILPSCSAQQDGAITALSAKEASTLIENRRDDPEFIIPVPQRSLADDAVDPWSAPRYKRERAKLKEFGTKCGVSRAPSASTRSPPRSDRSAFRSSSGRAFARDRLESVLK